MVDCWARDAAGPIGLEAKMSALSIYHMPGLGTRPDGRDDA